MGKIYMQVVTLISVAVLSLTTSAFSQNAGISARGHASKPSETTVKLDPDKDGFNLWIVFGGTSFDQDSDGNFSTEVEEVTVHRMEGKGEFKLALASSNVVRSELRTKEFGNFMLQLNQHPPGVFVMDKDHNIYGVVMSVRMTKSQIGSIQERLGLKR